MHKLRWIAIAVACILMCLVIVTPTEARSTEATTLINLAVEEFGDLTFADEVLFEATADGRIADYRQNTLGKDDPNASDNRPTQQEPGCTVNASRIVWLCTDKAASELVTYRGLQIIGARIEGPIDLAFATIPFPLAFCDSSLRAPLNLEHSQILAMNLTGTFTGPIHGDSLQARGGILLRGNFNAQGEVTLRNACIGGLDCSQGRFSNSSGPALILDGISVLGSVFFREGFKAAGEVRLPGATISGQLDCSQARFANPAGDALVLDGATIKGGAFLNHGFQAEGTVRLPVCSVSTQLNCRGGHFIDPGGNALVLNGATIDGSVFLDEGFLAKGVVRLTGAQISGQLDCSQGLFINERNEALVLDSVTINGGVSLDQGFMADGMVRMPNASIGVQLCCRKGRFINDGDHALLLDGSTIKGSVFFDEGFCANGEVRLTNTTITGQLNCRKGEFINPAGHAINASFIKANEVLLRDGFIAKGMLMFTRARIDHFVIASIGSPDTFGLDLQATTIGILSDDPNSWPQPTRLALHGLAYDDLHGEIPLTVQDRLDWLRRQPGFWPQSYEQLASVYHRNGDSEAARQVLMAKNRDKARLTELTLWQWIWYSIVGPVIGYGYEPWNAFLWVIFMLCIGFRLFELGYTKGLIVPPTESAYVDDGGIPLPTTDARPISTVYPRFSPVLYSIDIFIPVIDFHQAKYWLPNANATVPLLRVAGVSIPLSGRFVRGYMWFHILAGWVLTTLLVAGLMGLLKT